MFKIGSNHNNAAKTDYSYIKIEPIINPHRRREKNKKTNFNDLLEMNCDNEAAEEAEQTRRRRRDYKLAEFIIERLETKIDQKIRNHVTELNQKIDKLSNDVSSIKIEINYLMQKKSTSF